MASHIEDLIAEIYRLNDELNAMISPKLTQALNPPATEDQIAALEAHLGMALPPSYREFLRIANGWAGFDAKVNLLSVEEHLQGEYAAYVHQWKGEQWAEGESVPVEAIVFGIALHTNQARLFDTHTIDAAGEMQAVWWEDEELHRYANLTEMFEQYVDRLRFIIERRRNRATP